VRIDNGPEFTRLVLVLLMRAHRIRHVLIQPGLAMQNGYIGGINGKFRDERTSEHWFQTMHVASIAVVA